MIYYFGYYKSKHNEDFNPSGSFNAISFKMDYIIRKLKESGKEISVISSYISEKTGLRPYRKVVVDTLQTDHYLPSLRVKGCFSKITGFFRYLVAFIYLFLIVKPGSTVIVYHHPSFSGIISLLKIIKKIRIILEIEEVYYVNNKSKNRKKMEEKEQTLFSLADSYIIVNDLIYDKYLHDNKKNIVIYGSYECPKLPEKREQMGKEKIDVLFSGSIDQVRGAHLAVSTADYLGPEYCLHISGSGAKDEVESLMKEIEQHNKKEGLCTIIYHGQLSECELDKLAFSCDIGMNLQDVNNPFEAVSFPSKISFYLMHGLNVVSTKMSSVIASKLCPAVCFCEQDPKIIANTVENLELCSPMENQMKIKKLDKELLGELRWLID